MLSLNADLDGRLRNTELPRSKFLFPVFEAVVNSIYAIDDRSESDHTFKFSKPLIEVKFVRESQTSLDEKEKPAIKEIIISDNGIGFTDDNFNSFLTLDSKYHDKKGCKGVGRLLWLKEFGYAVVSSKYLKGKDYHYRSFKFTNKGVEDEKEDIFEENVNIGSNVRLCTPKKNFQESFNKCSLDRISKMLFEHCLWFYLRRGGCPRILIQDGKEEVDLDNLYEQYRVKSEDQNDSFEIRHHKFNILHVKIKKADDKNHVFYCAGNRVVKSEKLNIVGLYESPLNDGEQSFYYQCYVTSDYLDEKVSSDRFSFMIEENNDKNNLDDLFGDIVFDDIRKGVIDKIKKFLEPFISENIKLGKKRITSFIDTKAPYYRPLVNTLPDSEKSINPNSTDKAVDAYLHTKLYEQEHQLLEDGHNVLKVRDKESEEDYKNRVEDYFKKAQNLKQSDLARYVIHRKIILEFLEDCIKIQDDNKYSREDRIHQIIMPMHFTSDSVEFGDNNLWLINDRLVFHHYLASDKTFKSMKITDSESIERPDIISEFVYNNPLIVTESDHPPYASFSIIEFKRPMRNNFAGGEDGKDPIKQCIDYVKEIKRSKKLDKYGRQLALGEDIPAYCYIICDLTPTMVDVCVERDLKPTYDKLGYFGYLGNFKIYIEVISFDQLLNSAKERNAAFFDKLGLSHD